MGTVSNAKSPPPSSSVLFFLHSPTTHHHTRPGVLHWKQLVLHDRLNALPVRHVKVLKLQQWWHQLNYELQGGRKASNHYTTLIQKYYRRHDILHRKLQLYHKNAANQAKRDMRNDHAIVIQKYYRRYRALTSYHNMFGTFQRAVWDEYLNEQVVYIQRLGRYYIDQQKRKYLQELQSKATLLKLRDVSATVIQTRLYRGPKARARVRRLMAVRTIQKYFRRHHIGRRTHRMWRSLGVLSRRPKPTGRTVSFFGAQKLHLFSSGKNNWALKEKVGKLSNYVLHDLGTLKRHTLRTMPIRPVFFDRKEQLHRAKMKQLKQVADEDRKAKGTYECKKCLQRGKYPGHMCCCHVRGIICRNCAKNQRSLKINGRPKTLVCGKRKINNKQMENGEGLPAIKVDK